jgi:1-acyl-sn-glycerol-3-phosphate acyltransferase
LGIINCTLMRTLLLLAIYVVLTLFVVPVLMACACIGTSVPLFVCARFAVGLGRKILGLRLHLSGFVPQHSEKTFVFMPNHTSLLDGPLMFLLIPQRIRVILKKEIFRLPVLGLAMRMAEFVPVDRKGKESGKKSIQKAVQMIKEKKYSFLIFPEGTRSPDGRMQDFRRGGFFLALESQTDIVPVSIRNTFALLPKGSFFVKKGIISVVFHPPVSLKGRTIDDILPLMKEVKKVILSG